MRIAIVGGSVTGLGAALDLAREGHQVTVLERDAAPLPASPVEAFEKWERRGAPQVRHSHAFLARLRNGLRDRAPDLLEELLEAGAEELRFADLLPAGIDDPSPRPGDEDLVMLACRRLTFEWVLRRAVEAEPGVAVRGGVEVRGLAAEPGRPPRVTGVHLRDGERLDADLVLDASGRRSRLPRWLQAIGAAPMPEESEDCGIFYCSRFYRLRPDARPPQRDTTIGADLGYFKYAIFHGDSRIFSVTFAASPLDAPLRRVLRTPVFEAATRAFPQIRPWVGCAEPISDVHGMAKLRSMRRSWLVDGEPLALGVLPVGDAAIHTNPLYGRGCTFALVHAWLLGDAVREHADDLRALAAAFDAATERELVPWFEMSRRQDRAAAELAAHYTRGETPEEWTPDGGVVDPKAYLRALFRHGVVPALRLDATVGRAFFRSFNLLDPPADLMKNPDLMVRVLRVFQSRDQREEPRLGPDRDALLRQLEAA